MFRKNAVLGVAAGALVVGAAWTTLVAFDPQPDPPAFGVISITPDQTIRLNAVCSEHGVKGTPAPCRAELMFHDAAGNVLASQTCTAAARAERLPRLQPRRPHDGTRACRDHPLRPAGSRRAAACCRPLKSSIPPPAKRPSWSTRSRRGSRSSSGSSRTDGVRFAARATDARLRLPENADQQLPAVGDGGPPAAVNQVAAI